MSLYINFDAHSWYKGFAIKDNKANDYADYANKVTGYVHRWEAYTDNGNTYMVDELKANTLAELKDKINGYHLRHRNGYGERYAKNRLNYLRTELRAERMSYGELHELTTLIPYIEDGDVELLEAAGVEEKL